MEARVYNALVEALNEKVRLPKYILIILDKDAIEGVMYRIFDCGFKVVFREAIEWLIRNIEKALAMRKEDLRNKKPCALSTSAEPRLIWVTFLIRPHNLHHSVTDMYKLVKKSNQVLEECVERFNRYNHIL